MFNTLIIISSIAAILSTVALIIGCVALTFVIGVKNSTHQVVWKEADPHKNDDPFTEDEEDFEIQSEPIENPNKRIKPTTYKKFENAELLKAEESFRDLDDPSITSNFA